MAEWMATTMKPEQSIHVDLISDQYKPVNSVFTSLRPDIVIVDRDAIYTLELTICHETNLSKSKQYKTDKYAMLANNLTVDFLHYNVKSYTVEVSTLGFISDIN